jgi:surface antigen
VFCAGALVAFALPGGGCSTSVQIGPQKEDDKPLHTGLVATRAGPAVQAAPAAQTADEDGLPPDTDLAFAKVAATEVLARGGKDASVPWENPASGARGTITPLANAYRMEGEVCRDFLASYVAEGSESWMQGEACRAGKGKWEIRRLKPWRRT